MICEQLWGKGPISRTHTHTHNKINKNLLGIVDSTFHCAVLKYWRI